MRDQSIGRLPLHRISVLPGNQIAKINGLAQNPAWRGQTRPDGLKFGPAQRKEKIRRQRNANVSGRGCDHIRVKTVTKPSTTGRVLVYESPKQRLSETQTCDWLCGDDAAFVKLL